MQPQEDKYCQLCLQSIITASGACVKVLTLWGSFSCCVDIVSTHSGPGWPGTCCADQADLELSTSGGSVGIKACSMFMGWILYGTDMWRSGASLL